MSNHNKETEARCPCSTPLPRELVESLIKAQEEK